MTDAAGLTTTYTYDALGRVIAETKSGGGVRPDTTTTTNFIFSTTSTITYNSHLLGLMNNE
jgi:YD repeat-containing protein